MLNIYYVIMYTYASYIIMLHFYITQSPRKLLFCALAFPVQLPFPVVCELGLFYS